MTTFEYIMNKREKVKEIEDKIKELEEQIKREEEKISKDSLPSWRSNDKTRDAKIKPHNDQRTKSCWDYPNETSKASLLRQWAKSQRHELEGSKEDDIFHLDNESDSKDNPDNEMGFRITATSMFKNNLASTSQPNDNSQECLDPEQNTNWVVVKKQSLLENDFKNSNGLKFTALHVIEDVTESKEMSQRGYDSFKSKDSRIFRIRSQDKFIDRPK